MKRFLITISMVLIIILTGCDPRTYYIDSKIYLDETISIELRESKNESPIIIKVSYDMTPSFDYSNTMLIETLESSEIEEFIKDLSNTTFHLISECVNSPIGYTLVFH